MLSAVVVTGRRTDVEEFLCRWDKPPDRKNAELMDGLVYVPSPQMPAALNAGLAAAK